MPPVRVDQVIPSLASRDAIGVHTVAISDALRQVGIESDIFYGECTRDLADRARPMSSLGRPTKGRWLLYQASIGSPVFDIFASRSEPKLLNYHNITPAALLDGWEPAVGHEVSLGRSQVTRVASECRLAIADSAFNEEELVDVGFAHTAVAPLLIDMTAAAPSPTPRCRVGWPTAKPAAAPTSCSWARCPPTRPSTTWSRCWRCTVASTTTGPGSTSWARPWARPTGRRCRPSSPSWA